MQEPFFEVLAVGGKSNSLGRSSEVIDAVLQDKARLDELYDCMLNDDPWVRMRAADCFEKLCRQHPEWIAEYVPRFEKDLIASTQPSIQWHLAQMYAQLDLNAQQKTVAIQWIKGLLKSEDIDWIVSGDCMDTLMLFVKDGSVEWSEACKLFQVQLLHRSAAVVKRAQKHLDA